MKLNINNWTLTCKDQRLICDNCLFCGKSTGIYNFSLLNRLCNKFNIIFVKETSPDLFDL